MTGWTATELRKIGQSDELDLQSQRTDGSLRDPVTMWVVRHDDDLYVRAVRGRDGWYKGTRNRHQGHIRSAGIRKDVAFEDADGDRTLDEALDRVYRTKYRSYADNIVGTVVTDRARAATLKLVPR